MSKDAAVGIGIVSIAGGAGFGIWVSSFGAGLFASVVVLLVILLLVVWESK